jgi:hypothetical protein
VKIIYCATIFVRFSWYPILHIIVIQLGVSYWLKSPPVESLIVILGILWLTCCSCFAVNLQNSKTWNVLRILLPDSQVTLKYFPHITTVFLFAKLFYSAYNPNSCILYVQQPNHVLSLYCNYISLKLLSSHVYLHDDS